MATTTPDPPVPTTVLNVTTVLDVAGRTVELHKQAVLVDGTLRPVPPASMALLHALAVRPGVVLSRSQLLAALPGGGDDTHAVETAVARLRSALGAAELVQTVIKRGYRLAPPSVGSAQGGGSGKLASGSR